MIEHEVVIYFLFDHFLEVDQSDYFVPLCAAVDFFVNEGSG